jgi:PKD repeat protein
MTTNPHIVRNRLIHEILLIVLMAELSMFGAAASAQKYATGLAPAPSSSPTGNAMSSGAHGTPTQPSPPMAANNASPMGITATLLGVPVYGTVPLTVDFYVGLAGPHGSIVYQWNFGDGAASLLRGGVYMLHVYQHPGTYLCSLNLTTAQGRSTTVFTTITVKSSGS